MRDHIALALCVLSAVALGVGYWHFGRGLPVTLWELALVWFNVAWWLGGNLGRLLGLRPRDLHAEAKRSSWRLTGLALWIERCAYAMAAAAAVLSVAQG